MDKISGKPRPPSPPPTKKKIKDGKVARFALRAVSSLIWGMGACCSILFCLRLQFESFWTNLVIICYFTSESPVEHLAD